MKRRATYQGGDVHEHTTAFLSQGCSATFGTCNRNSNVCGSECRLLGDHPFAHPEADALVVKELSQLTVGEREGIEEEIHGVGGDIIEETQEMITECLARMQKEIDLCRKKSAYEQALFLSPHYVHDREFRLLFLRAEKFEASAAARRFIKYFDAKLFFWGQDLLCRDCTWNDLSEDDRSAVNTGSIWFSDKQDQSGRTIVWLCQKLEKFTNYKNQIRNVWYQLMEAVKDVQVQRKGFVKVVFNVGMGGIPNIDTDLFLRGAPVLFEVLPFRMAAVHFCYDDPMIRPALTAVQHAIGRSGRIRFRAHYGSLLECQYALMTFGIHRSYIPFDESGCIQLWKIRNHLDKIQALELQAVTTLLIPTASDVLMGRGKPFQSFPGNIKLGLIIDQYRERYLAAGRCDKAIISQHVVDFVHGYNGRFLKRPESKAGEWIEVSNEAACDKVGHGFRSKAKRAVPVPCEQQNVNRDCTGSSLTREHSSSLSETSTQTDSSFCPNTTKRPRPSKNDFSLA